MFKRSILLLIFSLPCFGENFISPMTKYYNDAPEGAKEFWVGIRFEQQNNNRSFGLDVNRWESDHDQFKLSSEISAFEMRGFYLFHTGGPSDTYSLYGGPGVGLLLSTISIKNYEYSHTETVPHAIAGVRAGANKFFVFVEADYTAVSDWDGLYISAGLSVNI